MSTDWRLPEHRREAFLRYFAWELDTFGQTGNVYMFLPRIAEAYGLDDEQRAWLAWLDANTEYMPTSLLLFEASGRSPKGWRGAVELWVDEYDNLRWDADRRHQKRSFGVVAEHYSGLTDVAGSWARAGAQGWTDVWRFAKSFPYMGRLSAWYFLEDVRILLGSDVIPDSPDLLLRDGSGSRSHRNGLAFIAGYDSVHWGPEAAATLGIVEELEALGAELLGEVHNYTQNPTDVSNLTLETALCAYKGWHNKRRRYPNVYVDEFYHRIKHDEQHFGKQFDLLWQARADALPAELLLESNPLDPGVCEEKLSHYQETGQPVIIGSRWPDMLSDFDREMAAGGYLGMRAE